MTNLTTQQKNVLDDLDTLDRIERFANLMATAQVTIPKDLQNQPGDCLALSLQAQAWGMNPFAVAQKAYVIKGKLGYEAQLVNAVIIRHAPITGRPVFRYSDGWEKVLGKFQVKKGENGFYNVPAWQPADEVGLWCEVSATMIGEDEPRVTRMMLVQAQPRYSTQWATDPKQQLSYACMKRWARLHCPDVILGIYTPEELEQREPPEKDVTPTHDLQARLNQHGETVTVRTESDQPSARAATDHPEGKSLTGTEKTPDNTHTEDTDTIDVAQDHTERIQNILRQNHQVPVAEPTEEDVEVLKMAIDSLQSCRTLEELKQCANNLKAYLHPELAKKARTVYLEMEQRLR